MELEHTKFQNDDNTINIDTASCGEIPCDVSTQASSAWRPVNIDNSALNVLIDASCSIGRALKDVRAAYAYVNVNRNISERERKRYVTVLNKQYKKLCQARDGLRCVMNEIEPTREVDIRHQAFETEFDRRR